MIKFLFWTNLLAMLLMVWFFAFHGHQTKHVILAGFNFLSCLLMLNLMKKGH